MRINHIIDQLENFWTLDAYKTRPLFAKQSFITWENVQMISINTKPLSFEGKCSDLLEETVIFLSQIPFTKFLTDLSVVTSFIVSITMVCVL